MMQGCILVDLYQWGNAIDGSMSSSMELIPIRGKILHETGQMHPRMSALIHGWGKYPWMINFHGWGATITLRTELVSDFLFLQAWRAAALSWSRHRLDGILRLGKQVISLSYRSVVVGYWIIKIMFLSVFFARLACLLLLLFAH